MQKNKAKKTKKCSKNGVLKGYSHFCVSGKKNKLEEGKGKPKATIVIRTAWREELIKLILSRIQIKRLSLG